MKIPRTSVNSGLALGAGMGFMALIGMLTVFESRFIIAAQPITEGFSLPGIALSIFILAGALLGVGALAARRQNDRSQGALALNGALAGGLTILVTIGLVIIAQQVNVWADTNGMAAVFPNVDDNLTRLLSLNQLATPLVGYLELAAIGLLIGAVGGLGLRLPSRYVTVGVTAVAIIIALGMLQDQINAIISVQDALWVVGLVTIGYAVAAWRNRPRIWPRVGETAAVGVVLGLLGGLLLIAGGAPEGTMPDFLGTPAPAILTALAAGRSAAGLLILLAIVGGALGLTGGALSAASGTAHRLGTTIMAALLMLGVLNATQQINYVSAIVITVLLAGQQIISGRTTPQAEATFNQYGPGERRTSQTLVALAGLAFVLIIPQMLSGYINNVVDLIGLFVMMGLGLNIVVGFAGLLDLGYVAFFAIGAYMTGILTTPNIVTCGVAPSSIPAAEIVATCTGITTFWVAWPVAIVTSGLAGIMLGIPVLRLRGDYLAIVTLGFGEIVRLVSLSDMFKPVLGGAQGIVGIPSPTIDLSGIAGGLVSSGIPVLTQLGEAFAQPISLSRPNEIYYLILAGVLLTAFVSSRLASSRLGRAWRAMRADEDVAQAMGINLTRTKLLAFSIGAAFAGLGGALFGSYIKSIFPNSFTLVVSINVLSLIIIGGLGSIPGVMVGALVIYGLPEALREFQEYRLLMFGALLVVMMILRPEGILPPTTPRLEERAEKAYAEEGA